MKRLILTLGIVAFAFGINAQQKKSTTIEIDEDEKSESPLKITHDSTKNKWTISIGGSKKGTSVDNLSQAEKDSIGSVAKNKGNKKSSKANLNFSLGLDLGLNSFRDFTNYTTSVYSGLATTISPVYKQNFDLIQGKSWNVNLWPIKSNVSIYKKTLRLQTKLGFQIYNFRFNDDITFHKETYFNATANDEVLNVTPSNTYPVSKNKLGLSYLSLPVTIQWRPKVGKTRLHFGAGAMVGYRIATWTKQISDQEGKVKFRNIPGFNDYNVNLVGEIGISKFVLYGTYSLTNMFDKNYLDMRPIAIGIRL